MISISTILKFSAQIFRSPNIKPLSIKLVGRAEKNDGNMQQKKLNISYR